MGTYNSTECQLKCPQCGAKAMMVVDHHFGYTVEMLNVPLGSTYPFYPRKAVQNGGCPEDGNLAGEGYVECPVCGKDFYVKSIVRERKLIGIEIDNSKKPHIPDDD